NRDEYDMTVSEAHCIIQLDGPCGSCFASWIRLLRGEHAQIALEGVRSSKPGIGRRILPVFVDGLLEIFLAPKKPFNSELVPEEAALQIGFVGLGIHRPCLAETGLLLRRQLQLNLTRHRCGHFSL